ncbi:MAG: 3-isopropylmalate dehydratase large subunit [Bacteroidota bacterium]|nr:3-isopropylmalate dehydratase large subunit [Candidatus Kapabacteria bacterium]MDW8219208.1 3-isopropylmalate dehydratase large subunit [Bacteroidota bacterium]
MGQTISEKILSAHAGYPVYQGEIAVVHVDGIMATDTTAPYAITAFREIVGKSGRKVWNPSRCALVIDHAAPAPTEKISNLHVMMREFAREQGCPLYDVGSGICHQIMVEEAFVRPGDVFVGADSHTCTYGGLGAFATGVGSTDLAAVMLTGKIWLKVPQTIRIEYTGTLPKGVTAKDLVLFTVGQLSISGATYQAIEYCGSALETLSLSSRMTIANMSAEMGAKTGIVHPTGLTLEFGLRYDWTPVLPDEDAEYVRRYSFDVSALQPQVAVPHSPDNVKDIREVEGTKITYAFIGSCVNARLEDLQQAAHILRGRHIHPNVRLLITPASKNVMLAAVQDGTMQTLLEAGATMTNAACGACVGAHLGIPGDGEVVISTANRNFKGRMGNPNAQIYLSSAAVVAASALTGAITHPAEFL